MQISRYVVVSYMHQWAKIGKNSVLMKKKNLWFYFFFKPCYSSSSSGENKYIFLCKKRLTKDVVAAKYKKVKPKCIFFFGIQAIHLYSTITKTMHSILHFVPFLMHYFPHWIERSVISLERMRPKNGKILQY